MSGKKERIDRRRVRAWLVMEEITVRDIQRDLGYRSHAPVAETLSGARDYPKVLTWLRDKGCPVEYLQLPERMKKQERA